MDELRTVTLKGAIERLQDLGLLKGLDESERKNFLKAINELT